MPPLHEVLPSFYERLLERKLVSGALLTDGQRIRHALIEQVTSPVQWARCVETLIEAGCDVFLELGSGQVLTKLVRSIAPNVSAFAADTAEKIVAFAETSQTASMHS